MSADVESMAYRHEGAASKPWHGLGRPVDHDADTAEMLIASGLDWTVSKRPLFTPTKPVFVPIELNMDGMMPVDDYFALVRNSDNRVLGPAGKDYVPTQNHQAFDFFKKFATAGHMRMETAGSLQGGKQVWVLAKLAKSFELPGNDQVDGYLLLSSPHVWGKSLVIKFVTIRVVCSNTLAMAMSEAKFGRGFRMPHVRLFDAEVAHEAEVSLGIATELFAEFEDIARKLANSRVSQEVVVRYVADVFQKELITEQFGDGFYKKSPLEQASLLASPTSPKVDSSQFKRSAYDAFNAINRQPGAGLESMSGTMWGCFNAVTYYADHLAGRDRDNALYSSWFGPRAATKSASLLRARQIAEAVGA